MWKIALLSGLLCLMTACAPLSASQAPVAGARLRAAEPVLLPQILAQASGRPQAADPRLAHLWLDMSMASTLPPLFNEYAGSDDIARADHVSLVDLLGQIEQGKRLVIFKNAADAEQLVPHLVGKLDIIGYNLESGPANRPDEQRDPVGSLRRVRALADLYGLEVAMGPDRAIALNYGAALAPYADYFVLQVQRVQTEPETVRDFVIPLVAQLRAANPALKVSIQIRTEGDVPALVELVASLQEHIDGVSILTNDETAAVAAELLAAVRPLRSEAGSLPPGPVTASPTPVLVETPGPRRTAPATPQPLTTPVPPGESGAARTLLLWAGLAALGVLFAGVVTTAALYVWNGARGR